MSGESPSGDNLAFATLAAHAGEGMPAGDWQPTSTPIYNASGFFMPSFDALDEVFAGTRPGFYYTRDGNPTVRAFETAVATLEAAPLAGAFSSGMAAIHAALLATGLKPGNGVLATQDCYGLTRVLLSTHFAELGIRTSFVDNTFASPYLLRPIQHGADLVVHSVTKYLGGHGDVTGGVVAAADDETGRRLHYLAKLLGAVLGPNEAWLSHRGLKTLPLRMARQCDNALQIARWLETHPQVQRVYYPGLPSHPQHELTGRLLDGRYGAMIAFDLKGDGRESVRRFMDALCLVTPAPTLGDLRTLTLYPVQASHRGLTPEQRRVVGIGDGLVRLSIGIEEPSDLIADLERGLAAVGG